MALKLKASEQPIGLRYGAYAYCVVLLVYSILFLLNAKRFMEIAPSTTAVNVAYASMAVLILCAMALFLASYRMMAVRKVARVHVLQGFGLFAAYQLFMLFDYYRLNLEINEESFSIVAVFNILLQAFVFNFPYSILLLAAIAAVPFVKPLNKFFEGAEK